MKIACVLVVPVAILFATTAIADEETDSIPLYRPVDIVTFMNDPNIKKELRIAPYQEAAIKTSCDRWNSRRSNDDLTIKKMSGPEKPAKIRALGTQRADELFQRLGLSASQLKRLKQLLAQHWGVGIFMFPEIQQSLGIDSDQSARIRKIRDELYGDIFLQLGENKLGQEEAKRRAIELGRSVHPRLRAELTDEQNRKLDGIVGARFKFNFP